MALENTTTKLEELCSDTHLLHIIHHFELFVTL